MNVWYLVWILGQFAEAEIETKLTKLVVTVNLKSAREFNY